MASRSATSTSLTQLVILGLAPNSSASYGPDRTAAVLSDIPARDQIARSIATCALLTPRRAAMTLARLLSACSGFTESPDHSVVASASSADAL